MSRSVVVTLLLAGGLTAAPVEKVKPEEVTPALVELVARPAVQRELKLSAEQRVTLIDGLDDLDPVPNEVLRRLKSGPQPLHCFPTLADIAKHAEEDKARAKLVASVLSKEQFARLQQVELQALGVRAIQLKRVADALALTKEQERAVFVGKPTDRAERLKAMIDGLTPAQRKVWDDLNGEKADLKVWLSAVQADEVSGQLLGVERIEKEVPKPPAKPDPMPPQSLPLPVIPPVGK